VLESDAQRDVFIEEFWRRRDPDPDTPRNEYRDSYLGLRDDKPPSDVIKEAPAAGPTRRGPQRGARIGVADRRARPEPRDERGAILDQLRALEDARRDGTIELPDGARLGVTNLAKIFWPGPKLTKGDLLRYYVEVAPLILPAVADRPLVMKRFPNGIAGSAFYQQRSRQEKPPAGVRIETLPDEIDPISEADARRFVGGSLVTLLYMTQIAAISQDPWFSRAQSPDSPDFVAFDLDPMPGVSFSQVRDVARWVRDELDALGIASAPKTSGSSGLHVFVKLPAGLPYEAGLIFAQIVATMVSQKHPNLATVERTVTARGRTVYVDYLQNIRGKSLACAYSARGSEFAGVSTPLRWGEVESGVEPGDFTIVTAPARFTQVGDLWAAALGGRPADLSAVFKYVEGARG